jgi:hypothetical protein
MFLIVRSEQIRGLAGRRCGGIEVVVPFDKLRGARIGRVGIAQQGELGERRRMLAPADVDSGLACGFTCVGCGATLVAKKGAKVSWHFAHHIATGSESCVESAIHAAAKQILLDANYLRTPMVAVSAERRLKTGRRHSKSIILSPDRVIRFDYYCSEVWEGAANVRPDVVGYRGERRILVEMYFTHAVDRTKKKKLEALGIPALEVALSGLASDTDLETIRQRVLEDVFSRSGCFIQARKVRECSCKIRSTPRRMKWIASMRQRSN